MRSLRGQEIPITTPCPLASYTVEHRATMYFDTPSEVRNDPEGEGLRLMHSLEVTAHVLGQEALEDRCLVFI